MKITAQLSGVNRPLSVELRLMTFVPAIFDSQEENHTAPGRLLLTKRSDFRSAEGLVRCSPFGGEGPVSRTNPPDDRNRSAGKCRRSLRTDDAKRSSLQNRAGHWAITSLQFRLWSRMNSSLRFDPLQRHR